MRSSPTMSPWEEHRFWVEIMLDHSIFVDEALPPEESEWISVARQYISSFTELLHRIDRTDPELNFPGELSNSPNNFKRISSKITAFMDIFALPGLVFRYSKDLLVKLPNPLSDFIILHETLLNSSNIPSCSVV